MKIAVVGAGIAGLVCGHQLHREHALTIFEANGYPGGHTNTVTVQDGSRTLNVDTGFIVYNDRTYPNFIRLLEILGVANQAAPMSFSVHCDRTGLEYNGTSLNGVFCQRGNLFRWPFLRMLKDILRFNAKAVSTLRTTDETTTVAEYLETHRYSREFADNYLLPMGAAIWSCPIETFGQFPIQFIIDFYDHHGLLQIRNRPTWRVIRDGSNQYVLKLIESFAECLRLSTPVRKVTRHTDNVEVTTDRGTQSFDEVIFACHSDQALRMLGDNASDTELEVLREFPYGANSAVLHTDETVLPKSRRAWASWNYHLRGNANSRPTLTYNMNILQGLTSSTTYCVTLNEDESIDPESILGRWEYSHPIFTSRRAAAQKRHPELLRRNRTSFCGAYWGNGFHEDGVTSALRVGRTFGVSELIDPNRPPATSQSEAGSGAPQSDA